MSWRFHGIFLAIATFVVGLSLGWGFYLVGSPEARRTERFDEQRLRDLQTIAREIRSLTVEEGPPPALKDALPPSLDVLAERARGARISRFDPKTGTPYAYRVVSETSFEVCAEFEQERNWDQSVFWNHPPGRHCFTIDVIDPPPLY